MKTVIPILFVVAMVAVIVGMDLLFFRHLFWARLAANAGVVLLFVAVYVGYVRPALGKP